jgi:hypothetical protein
MTKNVSHPASRKVLWIVITLLVCSIGIFANNDLATWLSRSDLARWISRPTDWMDNVREDSAFIAQLEAATGEKSAGFEQGYDDSSPYLRLFLRFPNLNDASKLESALTEIAAKREWKSVEHDYRENGKCYLAFYGGTRVSVLVDFGLGIVGPASGLSIHFAESEYGWCNLE